MERVFISYSHKDAEFVDKLADGLSGAFDIWIDKLKVMPGQSLVAQIGVALDSSSYALVVISATSIRSKWVNQELSFALQSALEQKTLIVPLLLEDVKIPQQLRYLPYINFARDGYEVGCANLVKMLKRNVLNNGRLNLDLFKVWGEIDIKDIDNRGLMVNSDGETSGATGFSYDEPIRIYNFKKMWVSVSGTQNCDFTKWSSTNQRTLKIHINNKPVLPLPRSAQVEEDRGYIQPINGKFYYDLPREVLDYGYISSLSFIIGKGIIKNFSIHSWFD